MKSAVKNNEVGLLPDYEARVYAGVLGKLVGVYLGRPCENWSHAAITRRWGEIRGYIHDDVGVPLIVADDDLTGTFTFVRALLDHGVRRDLTSREIGQTWLNYMAENRHILWWGGMGMSAEHTAYLRLAAGIEAPRSGSIGLNGTGVAEEIGAQIFIDGWAMVSPGQPELAAHFATEAARVSHDGEAVHGAVMIAVMESLAFVEKDIAVLVDRALAHIPADCRIARVIADLRRWRAQGADWRRARELLEEHHGYQHFGTNCPMVTNHGVIILALLYGEGDFDTSMRIVNTCGWDTDCNSGNLGCLLGIRNGLETFRQGYDWRTPVNDRLLLPSADGHQGVLDAASVALQLANLGRVLAGLPVRVPKGGARFHFDLPGATHGFAASETGPKECRPFATEGAMAPGVRSLCLEIAVSGVRSDAEVFTFLSPDRPQTSNYFEAATPALYPGQTLRARVAADAANSGPVAARLFVRACSAEATLVLQEGPERTLAPGEAVVIEWIVPELSGRPVVKTGVSAQGPAGARLHLDWMTWSGAPAISFRRPADGERKFWDEQFILSVSPMHLWRKTSFVMSQSRGRGILHTGSSDWTDYRVSAPLIPFLGSECGLALRVRGLTRYYGLLLRADGRAVLVRADHEETVLAEVPCAWSLREPAHLALEVRGYALKGYLNGTLILAAEDDRRALPGGGAGFLIADGRLDSEELKIEPL